VGSWFLRTFLVSSKSRAAPTSWLLWLYPDEFSVEVPLGDGLTGLALMFIFAEIVEYPGFGETK
jgi:hypothetical protein